MEKVDYYYCSFYHLS